MILTDTDAVVDFLRDVDPFASRIEILADATELAVSTITVAELMQGKHADQQRHAISKFLDTVRVLPLDRACAEKAGELRRTLSARGQDIGLADCAIAATALAHNCSLLTKNRKHFERVPGLLLTGETNTR